MVNLFGNLVGIRKTEVEEQICTEEVGNIPTIILSFIGSVTLERVADLLIPSNPIVSKVLLHRRIIELKQNIVVEDENHALVSERRFGRVFYI